MRHRIYRRHLIVSLAGMMAGAAAPQTTTPQAAIPQAATPQTGTPQAATPRDVATAVEIAAGQDLDPPETTAIIDNAGAIQRNDPQRFAGNTAGLAQLLAKWRTGGDPAWRATLAESLRLQFAEFSPDAVERRVVERHDPVIAYRSAPARLVSARTIDTLTQAALWTQTTLGGLSPDAGFAALCRRTIADGFVRMPEPEQDGLANLRRNWAAHIELWRLASPRLRAAVIARGLGAVATQADYIPTLAEVARSDWQYYLALRQRRANAEVEYLSGGPARMLMRQFIQLHGLD